MLPSASVDNCFVSPSWVLSISDLRMVLYPSPKEVVPADAIKNMHYKDSFLGLFCCSVVGFSNPGFMEMSPRSRQGSGVPENILREVWLDSLSVLITISLEIGGM